MKRGKLIVFEGIGGSGKGTQIVLAKKLLSKNKIKNISTREPGGIKSAEIIRNLIFDLRDKKLIGAEGQTSLFFAARKLWIDGLVGPKLDDGYIVLTDRAHTSTGAYQGYAEGGDLKKILSISEIILGKYKPDAVIFFDISYKTSKQRRGNDVKGDPFDKETDAYFKRLINGYRMMAKKRWGGIDWFIVDGEQSVDEVFNSVTKILSKILKRKLI